MNCKIHGEVEPLCLMCQAGVARELAKARQIIAADEVTINLQIASIDGLRAALVGSSIVVAETKERARACEAQLAECMEARRLLLNTTDQMRAEANVAIYLVQRLWERVTQLEKG